MLRITVMNEPGITRMKLEGKLAHEWVKEARNAWGALSEMNGEKEIVVDLLNVSFVDEAGHRLLTEIRHAGAELMGSGPLMSALIDEIEEAESSEVQDASN
jgi:anti-anti-sigma regulatory factor